MDVNVKGIFLGMKYVLQVMDKQGYGYIINMVFIMVICVEYSLGVYIVSKYVVVGLIKVVVIEYVCKGICINVICFGGVVIILMVVVF